MADRVLVAYATADGQTRRIAERLARVLRVRGLGVEVRDLEDLPEDFSLHAYGGILLGSPVHGGHHLRTAVDFARRHRVGLAAVPSGFFSVSLAAAYEDDESQAAARDYYDVFVEETGWDPKLHACLAGAFLPSSYGVFERAVMRLLAQRNGHGDIRWDQEYTDWVAVDRLARELAESLEAEEPATAAGRA